MNQHTEATIVTGGEKDANSQSFAFTPNPKQDAFACFEKYIQLSK